MRVGSKMCKKESFANPFIGLVLKIEHWPLEQQFYHKICKIESVKLDKVVLSMWKRGAVRIDMVVLLKVVEDKVSEP